MKIGIPGWLVGPNSFGVTLGYINFARDWLGGNDIQVLFPETPILPDLDLLLLPGGADINPLRYGEIPSFYTDKPDILKEYFDVHILPQYIDIRMPIGAICRGMQSICVHFGGKLYQDMYHETNKAEDPYSGIHNLWVYGEATKKIKVNSRHHQSVITPHNDSPINVLATHSSIKHHIEAIRISGYPIVGVQYHPEDLNEPSGVEYAVKLITSILRK
jgi:putative glutamine amidotransferase